MAFYPVLAGGVLIFSRDFFARFVECDRINNEKKSHCTKHNLKAAGVINAIIADAPRLCEYTYETAIYKLRISQIQIQVNNDESMNHGFGSKCWLRFALQRGSE